jgi:tripartite-type tricarboxylate transporter receptor subunit TctC
VLGGQTDLVFVTPAFALASQKEGKLRIIGATSSQRISYAPSIPTLAEQGFPGFELDTWNGFMAPRGTPADVVDLLNRSINDVMRQPDTAAKLLETGHEVQPMAPRDFDAFIRQQYERWGRTIRERKLQVEDA